MSLLTGFNAVLFCVRRTCSIYKIVIGISIICSITVVIAATSAVTTPLFYEHVVPSLDQMLNMKSFAISIHTGGIDFSYFYIQL